MKSLLTLFRWLFLLTLSAIASAGSANRLANPSFESGTGTAANDWTKFGNCYREALNPKTGSYSMKMYGNFTGGGNVTGAYQTVKVKPGERVASSTWAISKNNDAIAGNNFAVIKVVYQTAANVDLASSESKRITSATAKDTFQLISASLGPAPAGTDHAAVYILFVQQASTPFAAGSVFFDELKIDVFPGTAYILKWSDEFNGTTLNLSNWEPMIGDGTAYGNPNWGNNELQYYTNRVQNISVTGGLLKIIARKENFGGKAYTSARLRTLNKQDFTYGRFEARIKMPSGQGYWPAFWMLPSNSPYGGWASSGEIDIIETINIPTTAYGTIHYGGQWPNNQSSGGTYTAAGNLSAGFHNYRIDWEPDAIRWYIDGIQYFSRTSLDWNSTNGIWNQRAPFDQEFHILLNFAVGGNWPGAPNGSTVFPAELQVDWVRVYTAPNIVDLETPDTRGNGIN